MKHDGYARDFVVGITVGVLLAIVLIFMFFIW